MEVPFEKSFELRAGRRELWRQQRVGLVQGLSQAVAEVTGEGRKRSRPGATTGGSSCRSQAETVKRKDYGGHEVEMCDGEGRRRMASGRKRLLYL